QQVLQALLAIGQRFPVRCPRFTVIFTIFRGTTLKRETTRFSPMPLPHWVRNDETTVLVPTKSGICLTSTRLLLTMNPDGGA
ncbi:MAG: hypothetical protein QGF03_01820, partial [SAR324 cluster bacterium]|nr:hypothetical protein [SAR324 cluster bacterium]